MKEKTKYVFLGWRYKGENDFRPIEQMPKQVIFDRFIKPINNVLGLNLKLKAD